MESAATIGSGIEIRLSSIRGGGNGLWTARPFRRNELITEYCGPIIDHKKALKLRRLNRHSHIRVLNCQFMYIDGIKQPKAGVGGASFANDARDTAQNNAVFVCRHDNKLGRDRVYLKAVRDLPPGTEVFVGYGRDYWRNSRQPAAAAPKDQQSPGSSGSGSGSDSDTGNEGDEAVQQEQDGNLSLSSDKDSKQQQQQQRTRYGARQHQQQRRCQQQQQQQQQAEVLQSQQLPLQANRQQQQQQVSPGLLVSMGQGQWSWVGPGLTSPFTGLVPAGIQQPAQHPHMQQAAGGWLHPSMQAQMVPHLHQQQPVRDAAEAAAQPFEPWQVAAALTAPLLRQRWQQQQQQQQNMQASLGSEPAADTHGFGIHLDSSNNQGAPQQRACVSAYKQQQQQQHSRQGSLDSNEAECSKDGGGGYLRGQQQQHAAMLTFQQQQHQQHRCLDLSLDSNEAEDLVVAVDAWQQEGTQGQAAAAARVPAAAGLYDGHAGGSSWDAMQQQQQGLGWFATHQQWCCGSGDATYGGSGWQQDGVQRPSAAAAAAAAGGLDRSTSEEEEEEEEEETVREQRKRRSCTSVYRSKPSPIKRVVDPYKRVYTHSREGGLPSKRAASRG